jgi:hypothetical protein
VLYNCGNDGRASIAGEVFMGSLTTVGPVAGGNDGREVFMGVVDDHPFP